ncbi:MAG: MarC family protein [Chloroflexota bacterium]
MMITFLKDIGLSFIPLFVAVDALGVLPFVLTLTQEMTPRERPKVIRYAMLTAFALGLLFIGIGKSILFLLGISINDLLLAGGLLLLVLSIRHLTTGKLVEFQPTVSKEMTGVVPLGTPLVVGPAVLTTLLLLTQQRSVAAVVISFAVNLIVAWFIFVQANRVARILHEPGLRAASQIASLLLAAIAVMMIRKGLLEFLK